jgi:protein-tyrosine phosphatase
MQGPQENTTDHVWRMVWHELESPAVIVMLTTDKGYPYFPGKVGEEVKVNESDEFEDNFIGSVRCVELNESEDGATHIRKLIMKVDGEEREKIVWHLLFTAWPDYGIPNDFHVSSLMTLIQLSRSKRAKPTDPAIVHCRAGVGRTGTFIALDHMLGELDAGAFKVDNRSNFDANNIDDPVYDTVNRLRMQRPNMVQAAGQYKFIYEVLKKEWEKMYGRMLPRSRPGTGSRPGSARGPDTKTLRVDEQDDVFHDSQ